MGILCFYEAVIPPKERGGLLLLLLLSYGGIYQTGHGLKIICLPEEGEATEGGSRPTPPPGACSGSVSYSPNAGTLDRKKRRKTHLIKAQPSEFQLSFPFWIDKRLLVGRNREIPPLPLPGCRSTPPPFSIPSFGGETKATSGYIHWKRERGGGKGEAF